jgi:hypothetical protein
MINKDDLLKTIAECNNVNKKYGKLTRVAYDEKTNMVIMTSTELPDFKEEKTPEEFYRALRCSGWEYIPKEDKRN